MSAIHLAACSLLLLAPSALPAFGQSTPAGLPPADDGRVAPRYFEVVNASHDSVEAIALAPAGSGAFRAIDFGAPLRGGVTAVTLEVPAGGCARDVQVRFRGGRTLLYPAIDFCRARGLRLRPGDGRQGTPEIGLAGRATAQDQAGNSN